MTPHYQDDLVTLYAGDCLDVLRRLPDCSVDAVVTDPPYGLGFMGKDWDGPAGMLGQLATGDEKRGAFAYGGTHSRGYADNNSAAFQTWCEQWAAECLRVLKPGGHLLAFGGTRTWHRLACAIEDAGFEVRDSIAWMYGSGFPKSLDVSKAIDKAAGAVRTERINPRWADRYPNGNGGNHNRGPGGIYGAAESVLGRPLTTSDPATPDAARWQGWGTALKPAHEPIVVARKPLTGTVAANVLEHGTGALNIDGCRIPTDDGYEKAWDKPVSTSAANVVMSNLAGSGRKLVDLSANKPTSGRWPANVVLDEHQAAELDRQSGVSSSKATTGRNGADQAKSTWGLHRTRDELRGHTDTGGASRFFYTAKAGTDERPRVDGVAHPTVKPVDLMRWLVRLVTPPGGTVLEPFAGSGTTAEACVIEGFHCVAIEREPDYLPLIVQRLSRPIQPTLDLGA